MLPELDWIKSGKDLLFSVPGILKAGRDSMTLKLFCICTFVMVRSILLNSFTFRLVARVNFLIVISFRTMIQAPAKKIIVRTINKLYTIKLFIPGNLPLHSQECVHE